MSAIRLQEPGRFEAVAAPALAEMEEGDARVRIHRIGICGTDIHAYHGRQPFFEYPRILGHELGVEILELSGSGTGRQVGDLCSVEPYLNDPASPASLAGKPNCCEQLSVLGVHVDGGMRDELVIPASKLHASSQLDLDQLALVETLCIGAHGVERAQVTNQDQVVVVGAGPIGLGAIQFAKATGARVTVVDRSEARLRFCREVAGVDATLAPQEGEPVDTALRDLAGGSLPSVVIDATGHAGSMENAFSLAAHGGRIVFLGLVQSALSFDDPEFHRRELTLMASRNATPETFGHVIGEVEAGRVATAPWITGRIALEEVPTRFEEVTSAEAGALKAVIEID